jgi:hypothetical protein
VASAAARREGGAVLEHGFERLEVAAQELGAE